MLERWADEILFKYKHPFKYWTQKTWNWLVSGEFKWNGANYPEHEKYKDGFAYSD